MAIRPLFNINDAVRKKVAQASIRVDNAIVQTLRRLGEQCVRRARESGDYTDQTGNLRSSIGFIVVLNGSIIERNFISASKDENGKGRATGEGLAEDLASKYSIGYVLIVVAGMNYAAAVESKSKDVLTSAEKYAEKQLPKLLERLKVNINKV
jgi:hypothetical protein